MRAAFATLAFAALAAATPQGVTSAIAPSGSPPAGCSENYDGTFAISPVNTNSKRSLEERNDPLTITLKNGILTDSQGRTGYVASNSQFQFDGPPQAGAIYTAGFSICSNGHLAIGNDETWYKCLSGTFYNLYLDNDAGQCTEIYLAIVPVSAGTTAPATDSSFEPSVTVTVPRNATGSTGTMSTGSAAMNGTMSGSSSGAGSTTTTGKHTGGGGATTKAGHTTATTGNGQQTTTGGASSAAASSSSSSSGDAGVLPTARGDVFGLAAGLLAMAVL